MVAMPGETHTLAVTRLTRGPRQHFFGYYDKPQFDRSGRRVLGLACDVADRRPRAADVAEIGLVDRDQDNAWVPLGETRAWNWQFGSLLQWLPPDDTHVIHNDRREGDFVAVVRLPDGQAVQQLPRPVFDVAPDGRRALSLNFARLARVRPETGFYGVEDPRASDPAPAEDGLWRMDLASGESELIVSLQDLANRDPQPASREATHYITHPLWNPYGSRIMFWHRWQARKGFATRLYTVAPDGSDLCCVHDAGNSHTTWCGADRILAFARQADEASRYWLFTDRSRKREAVDVNGLTANGHFTFSPGGAWLLTDTPPDAVGARNVSLVRWPTGPMRALGVFPTDTALSFECRCDLHPRWNRDSTEVCIDSVHEGTRQMYLLDVRTLTADVGV